MVTIAVGELTVKEFTMFGKRLATIGSLKRSAQQAGAVNMIPATRKLAGTMGRLQCKTAAYADYTHNIVPPLRDTKTRHPCP